MLKVSKAVEDAIGRTPANERSDITTEYVKNLMFKKSNLRKTSIKYDAPSAFIEKAQPNLSADSFRHRLGTRKSITRSVLSSYVATDEDNVYLSYLVQGFDYNLDLTADGYTFNNSFDLSSEISAIRALDCNYEGYIPGYSFYGQNRSYFSQTYTIPYQFTAPFMSGAGYNNKQGSEYIYKWTMLSSDRDVQPRAEDLTDVYDNENNDNIVTCLTHSFGLEASDITNASKFGNAHLLFGTFDNSSTTGDVSVSDLPHFNEVEVCSTILSSSFLSGIGNFNTRETYPVGMSWRGYDYCFTASKIVSSQNGFKNTHLLNYKAICNYDYQTETLSNLYETAVVYPIQDGVLFKNAMDSDAYILSGDKIVSTYYVNSSALHYLRWSRIGEEYTIGFVNNGFTAALANRTEEFVLPTGSEASNDDGSYSITNWFVPDVRKSYSHRYINGTGDITNIVGNHLFNNNDPARPNSIALFQNDFTNISVSPLREVYTKYDNVEYAIFPVLGITNTSDAFVPMVVVLNKETLSMQVVDFTGWISNTSNGPMPITEKISSIEIEGHVGIVFDKYQYVLNPKADPAMKSSWVRVNEEWVGAYRDSGILSRTENTVGKEGDVSSKYQLHDNVFNFKLSVLDNRGEDPIANGNNRLHISVAENSNDSDCFTVTNNGSYPIIPTSPAGASISMIVHPVLRKINQTGKGGHVGANIFLPADQNDFTTSSWEGFYFSAGSVSLNIPCLPSRMYSDNKGFSSTRISGAPNLPSGITPMEEIFAIERPRITGGFSLLPRKLLVGEELYYSQGE